VKKKKNANIPKYVSCLQQGPNVILQNMNTKCYVWGKSNTTHYLVPLSILSSIVVAASCMGMLVIVKVWGVFQAGREMEWRSTDKIVEKNLVQSVGSVLQQVVQQ
jgi:hypothetical protein